MFKREQNDDNENLFFLKFERKLEHKFRQHANVGDLVLSRSVILITVIITAVFIVIDFYRVQSYWAILLFRGSVFLLFAAAYGLLKKIKIKPGTLQFTVLGLLTYLVLTYYLLEEFSDMPHFFLPNAFITTLYFSSTIAGLRFKNVFFFVLINVVVFALYAILMGENEYLISQIPNVCANATLGVIAAYSIESIRRTSFIRNESIITKNQVIRKKNETLNKVVETRDRLFSIISHDLKSPVNSLKSLIGLLNSGDISEKEFKSFAGDLSDRVNGTYDLIENILFWSKAQIEGQKLEPSVFEVRELIDENLDLFMYDFKNKGIELKLRVPWGLEVYADRESMNLVMRNLISNALKFTQKDGKISIIAEGEFRKVKIVVEDTGVGIPTEKINQLFKFDNYSTVGTMGERGTGLGLSISKEFINRNNGQLFVESRLGKGTAFTITIPLAPSIKDY